MDWNLWKWLFITGAIVLFVLGIFAALSRLGEK
jgi:hypothetical protein